MLRGPMISRNCERPIETDMDVVARTADADGDIWETFSIFANVPLIPISQVRHALQLVENLLSNFFGHVQ